MNSEVIPTYLLISALYHYGKHQIMDMIAHYTKNMAFLYIRKSGVMTRWYSDSSMVYDGNGN